VPGHTERVRQSAFLPVT